MSDPKSMQVRRDDETDGKLEQTGPNQNGPNQTGPNLVVMYTLIAVALVVAIGLAMLIVWPFYQHRH
jgi:hypothetical protein